MRSVDGATSDYLLARKGVEPRDFLWIEGKNRSSGATETIGFWSDLDTVTVAVISGKTGSPVSRDYIGSGTLIGIDAIPLVSDLTIQTVNITLSQVDESVAQAIRGYEPRLAWVEIHRGLFNLDTHQLVSAPEPHFVGRINKAPITTPEVGGEGSITVAVTGHVRELTRVNAAKRSDETQKRRSDDRARRYADVAGQWDVFWGTERHRGAQNGGPTAPAQPRDIRFGGRR